MTPPPGYELASKGVGPSFHGPRRDRLDSTGPPARFHARERLAQSGGIRVFATGVETRLRVKPLGCLEEAPGAGEAGSLRRRRDPGDNP
jgi:hypothetical protein